jgi:hypothetical protein
MDHVTALNERSAERYVLGEMSSVETEQFERHFFECEECALAVEEGQVLAANARAVLSEAEPEALSEESKGPPKPSFGDALRAWWYRPLALFPAAAAVLLAAFSVYQGAIVIPQLQRQLGEARALPAFLLIGSSRGGGTQVAIPTGTPSFALAADIPPEAHFALYLCELSAAGRVVFQLNAPPPAEGQPITILVPAKGLNAGQYELAIYGSDSSGAGRDRVSTFPFELAYH